MANIQSQIKRNRQNEKRRLRNRNIRGSARTAVDDPLYGAARDVAKGLAGRGWMVVTGGGPGIMQAGMEGAGRDRSWWRCPWW